MTRRPQSAKSWEKRLRRGFRAATSRILAGLGRRRAGAQGNLDPGSIREVLVVRMNGRMGNTLFLTPLLAALHETLPGATIDVFSSYPDAADVLRGLPGLRQVMGLPHKGWWHLGQSLGTLRAYRANQYDLVIDPAPNSFGGRLAMLLCRARWRLGFGGEDQWLRLDCEVEVPADVRHEALRPLALLEKAFGHEVRAGKPRLCVANDADELAAGARFLAERLGAAARPPGPGTAVVGFFASARGKKDLGPEWWRQFWGAYLVLRPQTAPVEVLPTADQGPLEDGFASLHCRSPRALAATIAQADWFFSADTGPMHLASAAGVPTIAFFERTNPAAFGPINPSDVALPIGGLSPADVAAACARIVGERGSRKPES
jgi:ADP-heptose:LPS heptosyltransferase